MNKGMPQAVPKALVGRMQPQIVLHSGRPCRAPRQASRDVFGMEGYATVSFPHFALNWYGPSGTIHTTYQWPSKRPVEGGYKTYFVTEVAEIL